MSATIEGAETKPKRRPPAAGKGRPVGATNLVNRTLKEAILQSFNKIGGVNWLVKLADTHPPVYATLLGRVLPLEVTGANGGPLVVSWDMSGFSTPNAAAIASPTAPMIEGRVEDAVEVVADARVRGHADGEVEVGEAE
jgi:hypothetical protein